MSLGRLFAIICIYLLACGGWMVLGGATVLRFGGGSERLEAEIAGLWGGPLVQQAPTVVRRTDAAGAVPVLPESNRIDVDVQLDHRRKGLIWYPTFRCRFVGVYGIANRGSAPLPVRFSMALPDGDGTYEDFAVQVDGQASAALVDPQQGICEDLVIPPAGQVVVRVAYTTRGLGIYRYQPGSHIGRVRQIEMTVRSDAAAIDFPAGGLSPTSSTPVGDGIALVWKTDDLLTRRDIAIEMPTRLNPGPLTSRITFFAPVCLGFFFLLVGAITVVCRIPIHPMHYLFIAGGFFAFHLLLAYLVDHLDIHVAFGIATATTLVLVTTYLRGALGQRFPLSAAIGGQVFFLVLFSYSFFLTGMTGLTVAIGSVITLAVLMRLTVRTEWSQVFGRPSTMP